MSSKMSVSSLFDFSEVDCSKASDVNLDVILTAPEKEDQKRLPLHIILAIDCSGSMDGGKLESVKSTVDTLITHLTENDTLGVIGFNDAVWMVSDTLPMTMANKTESKAKIRSLRSNGCTNISGALSMAMERAVTSEKDKICRIVLLTDGLPSAGKQKREELVEMVGQLNSQVTLSTFGYGRDYDPELLTSMANMGKGNNFYIQKDTDCRDAFALELGGLLSLYAQDIKVTLTPSGNVTVKEFLSDYTCEKQAGYRGLTNGKLVYTIEDIYVGESKHALLKLEIPQASDAVCARATNVASIEIDYLDVSTKERVKVEGNVKIQYVKAGKAPEKGNEAVMKQLMIIQAAKIQKEAKEKADLGDYAGAMTILGSGSSWAIKNVMYDDTGSIAKDLESLKANFSNRISYMSTGSKMANAMLSGYTKNRSSYSGASNVFTSSVQGSMLQSFSTTAGEIVGQSTGLNTSTGDVIPISEDTSKA